MKLVILYGPTGVGKLTVVKILAERTNFRLCHAHLTHDLARSLFDWPTPELFTFMGHLRLEVFKAAMQANIPGLLLTLAPADPHIEDFFQTTQSLLRENGGEVHFVKLICDHDELDRRAVSEDRKKYLKITDTKLLRHIVRKFDLYRTVPGVDTTEIDTTDLTPEGTADRILELLDIQ